MNIELVHDIITIRVIDVSYGLRIGGFSIGLSIAAIRRKCGSYCTW